MVYAYYLPHAKSQLPLVRPREDSPLGVSRAIAAHAEEITPTPPWPHCKIFCAPRLGREYLWDQFIPDATYLEDMPDIFTTGYIPFVSEKARDVIVAMDDFEHTFTPFYMRDLSDNDRELTERRFYHLHIRRRVAIEDIGFEPEIGFDDHCVEGIGTIQNVPELREKLETLPIWQTGVGLRQIFMSNNLVESLQNAGVNNLDENQSWPCLWKIYVVR